ncbi:hypothetical protein ACHAPO_003573 [Fusarium lateritium]
MRLSLPFVALCAIPAAFGIAIPDSSKEIGKSDYDKHHEYKHHGEHYHGVHKYHHGDHKHKHKHLHPHEHVHHVHHKHPIKPCHILTKERVCKDFHELTDEVEKVIHVAQTKDCGNDESCWSGVVYHIYKLEHRLDVYDKEIDYTTLKKCFGCGQESYIIDCYLGYADALIRLLKVLKHKTKHLEGEVDRPVLTSINSLRSANYALTYEVGRRISCKKTLKIIMEKQGANDGSTKGSVQQAFSKFIYTPLITGEDFENKGSYGDPREENSGKEYNKEVKVLKHHHEHHHGHHHGHKHGHGHLHAHEHGHKHGHVYHKYKHDEYKEYEYKHDDGYKHDNKDKNDDRDWQFVDKDNYSLTITTSITLMMPIVTYRGRRSGEREDREKERKKKNATDREWFRRELLKEYAWDRGYAPEPPKWHSPHRSPYNYYNGNRRWEYGFEEKEEA